MYVAHSPMNKDTPPHLLIDHTKEVMRLVNEFVQTFDSFSIGEVSALMHDQGKKSDAFQRYIMSQNKVRGTVKHAMGGALSLQEISKVNELILHLTSLIVLGHHTGLSNYKELNNKLSFVPTELIGIEHKMTNEIQQATEMLQQSISELTLDFSKIDQHWYFSTLTRFCFTALIDADWLDTEAYFNPQKSHLRTYKPPQLTHFIEKLNHHMNAIEAESKLSPINKIRKHIYASAKKVANKDESFFALHAPTGSGKTLASLAFALHHAKSKMEKRQLHESRIIFALPLTNITEQTSKIYRDILGEEHVIEHHSQVELVSDTEEMDKRKLATENWNRPFIVTTTVQLFESLFSNRPSQARKLHRIANSVIIIDEYQKIPLHLLKPILLQLKILRQEFGVTVLFMSATPIALEQSEVLEGVGTPYEIIENTAFTYEKIKRVHYNEIKTPLEVDDLIAKMKMHISVLCIANTRKQAQEIFTEVQKEKSQWNKIYHLSTTMCGHHRMKVIREIKETRKNESIAVISTTILEAGVDVSFDAVFRMYAPLDSIIQSAGRCNREGSLKQGNVYLFELIGSDYGDSFYAQTIDQAKQFIEQRGISALENPEKSIEYFTSIYGNVGDNPLDQHQLHGENLLEFKDVARKFNMIEDGKFPVLCVSYKHFPYEIFEKEDTTRSWYRKMQHYTIPMDEKTIQLNNVKKVKELYIWEGPYDALLGYTL